MWNLKNDKNDPICETEIDSQSYRTKLCLPRWKWGWDRDGVESWGQQM